MSQQRRQKQNKIQVAIVILNYFSFADTVKLVEALQRQTVAKDLFVLVVDNASPNDSFAKLKPLEDKYTNVVVLQAGENLGYARGNNFGLQYLEENVHPQYVAIMNNDLILQHDSLENLVKKYGVLEKPAIVAPKQLDINGKELPPYRMNSFLDDCLNLFYIFKIFHKRNALRFEDNTGQRAMRVEMIPGSFMFTSFDCFKEMGFFYPNTFLYVEERFIAEKSRKMGLNNYILLDETYIHAHSKTIDTIYNQLEKYRMVFNGRIEFTRVCRPNGEFKSLVMKFLVKVSLLEIRLVNTIKSLIIRFSIF